MISDYNTDNTIKKVIEFEWEMFIAVNEGGERASCQEDQVTFEGMRAAQFNAWSLDAVSSYLNDLETAKRSNRNLVEEKYIHMSKTTEPRRYEALLQRVTLPSDEVTELAHEISDILLEQTCVLFEDYPYVSGQGRPLYSSLDYAGTSVETYQSSELLTYSARTLTLLKEHILNLISAGSSLAMMILENTVSFYGYNSLDSAEIATKEYADRQSIEISYGCGCCCDDCGDDCSGLTCEADAARTDGNKATRADDDNCINRAYSDNCVVKADVISGSDCRDCTA